ncbi:MAG TPA: hypothetical protein DCL40_00480 [Coxiellaceae bacterium]|nr:hypothetical protein [Coxiellaceae bacterium]
MNSRTFILKSHRHITYINTLTSIKKYMPEKFNIIQLEIDRTKCQITIFHTSLKQRIGSNPFATTCKKPFYTVRSLNILVLITIKLYEVNLKNLNTQLYITITDLRSTASHVKVQIRSKASLLIDINNKRYK